MRAHAFVCVQRKGLPHNGVDADPWGTQAVLAACESGLLVSQQTQRGVVSDANEQAPPPLRSIHLERIYFVLMLLNDHFCCCACSMHVHSPTGLCVLDSFALQYSFAC
jgi:hypothetical protein